MIFAIACVSENEGCARPADPARDMGAIADLIEVAFGPELEQMGNTLVADMRSLAVLGPLLTVMERVAPLAGGYVWEQQGRLVGNVTAAPEGADGRWFVSNVAVHPSLQGRGIGRRLMEAALEGIRRRGGRQVLLQVRTDNEPAQRLYRRLGFRRYDTIVELARHGPLHSRTQPRVPGLRRLEDRDWQALLDLARATTPLEAQRVRPIEPQTFRPTLGRRLREWCDAFLSGRQTTRWGLEQGSSLVAAVSILALSGGATARLDLAVRPQARGPLEAPLADYGLAALAAWAPRAIAATISTSHPEALQVMQGRSFVTVRSLDQMVLDLE
ncbi:MAG TPA: GNAT family N-acetyltransferase [Anaerolineae bacterium]|nr:GNAT family N-acetyltransferase [Anaerolineae bacterium]